MFTEELFPAVIMSYWPRESPEAVKVSESPTLTVRLLLAEVMVSLLPPNRELTPDVAALASRVTAEDPARVRASRLTKFTKSESTIVTAPRRARVSVPLPASMVAAASWAAVATSMRSLPSLVVMMSPPVYPAPWVMVSSPDPDPTPRNPAASAPESRVTALAPLARPRISTLLR